MANSNKNIQTPFLAVTALEEFWDISMPMVFLGVWCLKYSRRSFWEPLGGKIIEHPWKDKEKFEDARKYVMEVYERSLPIFAVALNEFHGIKYSCRYWRIVIGHWLSWFIATAYEKYVMLMAAEERFPDLATCGLSDRSFLIPKDTNDFDTLLHTDYYHLQLYTQILKTLGKNVVQKSPGKSYRPTETSLHAATLKSKVKKIINRVLMRTAGCFSDGCSIVMKNSYFSGSTEWELLLRTFGKVCPCDIDAFQPTSYPTDWDSRSSLKKVIPVNNDFERVLNELIIANIPQSFVEGFDDIRKTAKESYPLKPKAIFSANSWYFDEHFKLWAAELAEDGAVLLGTQHGGNYGSFAYHHNEDHELKIVDKYFTWGWERSQCKAEMIPFFAPKLTKRTTIGASNKMDGVLFAACLGYRYFVEFPFHPDDFVGYLDWQSRFVKHLDPKIRQCLCFREHHRNDGWDPFERLSDSYPEVRKQTWKVPFWESIKNCRIFVCDHISTTFVEALSCNKPSIFFWDPTLNKLRPEAEPYYDSLRRVGILYNTPEEAAGAVSLFYEDVGYWWNGEDLQKAREAFCERFARTSPRAIDNWASEFTNIIQSIPDRDHP